MSRLRAPLIVALSLALLVVPIVSGPAGAASSARFGSPFRQWVRAHPANHAHCPMETCYGQLIESRPVQPQFTFVQTQKHRVAGYNQALRRGSSTLAAELQVAEQLPEDVTLPHNVTVIHDDRYGHSCAVTDLYSASLAAEFGSKGLAGQGDSIGVEFATTGPGGLVAYNPNSIDLAIVVPEYLGSDTNC